MRKHFSFFGWCSEIRVTVLPALVTIGKSTGLDLTLVLPSSIHRILLQPLGTVIEVLLPLASNHSTKSVQSGDTSVFDYVLENTCFLPLCVFYVRKFSLFLFSGRYSSFLAFHWGSSGFIIFQGSAVGLREKISESSTVTHFRTNQKISKPATFDSIYSSVLNYKF